MSDFKMISHAIAVITHHDIKIKGLFFHAYAVSIGKQPLYSIRLGLEQLKHE